ncbi:MAG: phage tail protein [Clostridiales Family XIII bacterium]|jgi:hypothetical protein|nr:phage tail protein [Clostridiales Family XIII bacterium]
MSQNNANNVSVGKPKVGGAIFTAPKGTVVPTSATEALGEAFVNIGYASEDGLTETPTRDSEAIKAWGGDTVLSVQTGYEKTFGFKAIELNTASLELVFGADNVTVGPDGVVIKSNAKELPVQVFVFELVLSNGEIERIVVPVGKVSEVGEITYVDNEPIGFEVTITALPDAEGNSDYRYIARPIPPTPPTDE